MRKNATFTGQPIFTQLLSLIPRPLVQRLTRELGTDRYYKKFLTYPHLVTMLYAIFHGCTGLREVTTGLLACHNKIKHLGISYYARRSTFADANKSRNSEVFKQIYVMLYRRYQPVLPDSRSKHLGARLFIVDSTTISLFQEILKNAGRSPVNGKRKGGIKAHMLMKFDEDVPRLVKLTSAASHDTPFIKKMCLPTGSIVVFDMGYLDYRQYQLWTKQRISWVTRLRKATVYEVIKERTVRDREAANGVMSDQVIIMGHNHHDNKVKVKARLVKYYDKENDREFEFVTNNLRFKPTNIALCYKRRWQIEQLFKRIKQNFPLRSFLGDNENAIRIQIWCALIADLLLKVIIKKLKRPWSFSNLSSMVRIHLMTYINLVTFLESPDSALLDSYQPRNKGPTLFSQIN